MIAESPKTKARRGTVSAKNSLTPHTPSAFNEINSLTVADPPVSLHPVIKNLTPKRQEGKR